MQMNWDVIGVGINLLTVVFLAGGFVYSVHNLSKRMVGIEHEMKQIITVMITQGRQEERMNAMDQRILAQGKRLDEFLKIQGEAVERMARMVENVISRVNQIADRNFKEEEKWQKLK